MCHFYGADGGGWPSFSLTRDTDQHARMCTGKSACLCFNWRTSPLQLLNNYWWSQKHCTCDQIYNVLGTTIPSPDAQKSPTESWRLIKAEKIKQVGENGPAMAAALHPENLPAPPWYGCVCVINAFLTTWCTDVPSTQAQFTYWHHFWERRAVTQHMLGLLRSSLCIRPHMWAEAGDDIASSHLSIITCFLFPTCQIWYFGIVIYPFCFPLFLNFHPYPERQNLNQRNCHEAILLASYKSSHCSRWLLLIQVKRGGLYLSTHQICQFMSLNHFHLGPSLSVFCFSVLT